MLEAPDRDGFANLLVRAHKIAECSDNQSKNDADKSTGIVTTITLAGDCERQYAHVAELLPIPREALDGTDPRPILWAGDQYYYLKGNGYQELKRKAYELLQAHGYLFVLCAEKLTCLEKNPHCLQELFARDIPANAKRSVTLVFEGDAFDSLEEHLRENQEQITWNQMSANDTAPGTPIDWESEFAASRPSSADKSTDHKVDQTVDWISSSVLSRMRDEGLPVADRALTKDQIEKLKSAYRLRLAKAEAKDLEFLRRSIIASTLKNAMPRFSVDKSVKGSEHAALEFYDEHYKNLLSRLSIKVRELGQISANLYMYLSRDGDLKKVIHDAKERISNG